MGQKNGLHAFGYNSAESEQIWMKFGTLYADNAAITQPQARDTRSRRMQKLNSLCVCK